MSVCVLDGRISSTRQDRPKVGTLIGNMGELRGIRGQYSCKICPNTAQRTHAQAVAQSIGHRDDVPCLGARYAIIIARHNGQPASGAASSHIIVPANRTTP